MTGIDGYDWSVFGGNPVPGDPDVVRAIADQLRHVADTSATQNRLVQSVSSDTESLWWGPAAGAVRPTIGKLPGQLDKLVASYRDAADSLDAYWPALRSAQQLAVEALAKAGAAQRAVAGARADLDAANAGAGSARTSYDQASAGLTHPTGTQAAHLQQLQSGYQAAQAGVSRAGAGLAAANGQLAAAHALKDRAVADYTVAAGRAAGGLSSASSAGIHNPHHSWLSSAVDAVGSVFAGAAHQVGQFADGVYHAVKGPAVMLARLADPLTAPGELEELAKGLSYGITHPLAFGKALLDWKDLSDGNIAHWLGELAPAAVAAFFTGGASEVAEGADGLTALDRAGMTADDVAGLVSARNEDAAARIIMRGDDPVPGSIYDGGLPQPGREEVATDQPPGTQLARQRSNFAEEPVPIDSPEGSWGANVHDGSLPLVGDEGGQRTLQWLGRPTDLLQMGGTEEYQEHLALLPEWGARDEVTMVHIGRDDGPMWGGATAPQASTVTPGLVREGGGYQILVNHLGGASAVWTGPLPWARVPDPALVLRGVAKLAGTAGGVDGARVLSGSFGR